MPEVSIIIPIYNVKKYLTKCLNSVIAQTLEEIEVICVDDGSTDGCAEILDHYAQIDSRIKVIHKENSGYGHSMNVGLKAATGKYVGIVESDDLILPMMYETLYHRAEEFDLDIVKSDCYLYWGSFDQWRYCHVDATRKHYNRILTAKDRKQMFLFWMFTWTGIYRRSFLLENQIRWNETPDASFQDNGFWVQTMTFCQRAMWIDEAFYLYRQDNPASSMKSRNKMTAMVKEYDFMEHVLRERGAYEIIPICNYFRLQENRITFYRISDELKTEYVEIVREQYEQYQNDVRDLYGRGAEDYNIKWVRTVAENPSRFVREYLKRKRVIRERLDGAKKLVFWGTGQYAEPTFKRLFYAGYFPKLDAVVVSKPEPGQTFFGQPVRSPEELKADPATTLVIVTTGRKNFAEIEKRLKELGYWNYMDVFDFLELYWSL